MIERIRQHESPEDLSRLVSEQLDRALHLRGVHLLLLEPIGTFKPSAGSTIVRVLETAANPCDLPLPGQALPQDEASWLEQLDARLAVPVGGGGDRLHGILLLGEKKSEEPFSREDRRLLLAVARQIAVVCENAALRRQAADDARVKHDVLARLDADSVNLLKECPRCGRCYDRRQESCEADGVALVHTLPVDRTIDGAYRLDRLLGRGGMGAVYLASDLRLDRDVAVKLVKGGAGDEHARRRFDREARASARLRHPNIITVHAYGSAGPELAYLVMERLVGTTLRDEIQRSGGLEPGVVADWFDQVLQAVAFAHGAGVVHRDLKPENVFVCTDAPGRTILKVLDFGLAKLSVPDITTSAALTEVGTVMGTLAYMSPEQLAGQPVDERADIFALGVMVLEALTGRNPFRKADPQATVGALLHDTATVPGDAPDVRALDAVLQRCLAKTAEARFRSVAEMHGALMPVLRGVTHFEK